MLTKTITAVSVFCLVFPAAAFAQGFSQGDRDLLLNAFGVSSDDFDTTSLSVAASLGYLFTDNFEGALRQDFSFVNAKTGGSSWAATTRAAGDYHFDMGNVWPFVGFTLGYIYGDNVADSWVFGPEFGAKYFVNDATYIIGVIGIEWFSKNGGGNDVYDDGRWIYAVGIGFRW